MALLFFFHVRTTFPDFFLTLNDLTGAGVTLAGAAVGVAVWAAAGGLVCVGGLVTTGLGTGLGVGLVSGRSASVTSARSKSSASALYCLVTSDTYPVISPHALAAV